jgi:hypothetical protein
MENADKPVISFGDTLGAAEPAPAAAATPAEGKATARPGASSNPGVKPVPGAGPLDPPFGPIRSSNAWASMGLVIAACGLMGEWANFGGNLLHGGLLAYSLWYLLRSGFAAVQRTGQTMPMALPVLLLIYGGLRLALPNGMAALGWNPSDSLMDSSGALLTALGGLLALLMPKKAQKKDAGLPPAGQPLKLDQQFSRSLLAYLMIFIGLQMNWTDASVGTDSLGGILTLLLAMLMMWASWVSMWQLWQKPLVMGKLGLLLFLAPLEAVGVGLVGLLRVGMADEDSLVWIYNAYPATVEPDFIAYSGGPLLVTLASGYALYLIGAGAKEAVNISKQKKIDEVAARKAARAGKKTSSPGKTASSAETKKAESSSAS